MTDLTYTTETELDFEKKKKLMKSLSRFSKLMRNLVHSRKVELKQIKDTKKRKVNQLLKVMLKLNFKL